MARLSGEHHIRALASAYWTEIEHLLEAGERPVDYIRIVNPPTAPAEQGLLRSPAVRCDPGRGLLYLTDRYLSWTREVRGAIGSWAQLPLATIDELCWTSGGRFAVGTTRHRLTLRTEFCPFAQPHRRVTRFVWRIAELAGTT